MPTTPIQHCLNAFWAAWKPPPRLQVSEWAEQFRFLSPEASAEPGKWQNLRAPHLVAPMDALSPYDEAERVVGKFSSQTGKTEVILNYIGYIIDLDPGPILAIQPNVTPMGEAFSKDRVAPMLRDSPTLAAKSATAKSRTSASTITHKTFDRGHLTIAGGNSPAGLASRPIRYLVADELDRWEVTKEGDPLLLARKRQQTFRARRRSKELIVSSPTYDDIGICVEYDACTQQFEWQLQCQHCGAYQFPTIGAFSWDGKDASTVRYVCTECGGEHTLADEFAVKASGGWVQVKDGPRRAVGFWMNQFASPFARWDDTIQEWIEAQGDPAKMQAVTNTCFAQAWEGIGERIEPNSLRMREEVYADEVPEGVDVITMGCDVQADRLEVEVVGWSAMRESWSLAYHILPGEPTSEEVWDDLIDLYATVYTHANGASMKAVALCVDSGAFTSHVYDFVKRAHDRSIYPIKGASGMSRDQIDMDKRAVMRRSSKRLRNGKPAEILGVDNIKRTIYSYFAVGEGRPGYCHFPVGRSEEYYDQLTGERLVVVKVRGKRAERRWKAIHPNVEALDCRVYAYAALLFYGVDKAKRPDAPAPFKTEAPRKTINSQNKKKAPFIKRPNKGWITR